MAGGEAWFEVGKLLVQDGPGGDGDGEDGGLSVLGFLESFGGAFKDKVRKMEAESFISLLEDGFGGGEVFVELTAHANGLRTLAGEEEGWLDLAIHVCFGCYMKRYDEGL